MCTSVHVTYTCGCKREMEFVKCPERRRTNVRCRITNKQWGKDSENYCSRHLVKPDAQVKYTDQNGQIVEE